MYNDDPTTALYQGVINNMYLDHPVRNEILGTVESISTITKDVLEKTHQTFYHPSNMVLFVTGNFDVEETVKFIKELQKDVNPVQSFKVKDQPFSCNKAHVLSTEIEKEVLVPNFILGIKLSSINDRLEYMKKELCLSVMMDLVLGKSTENFKTLLANNLINDTYGMDISLSDRYSYFLIGSETNNPVELKEAITEIFSNMKDLDITDELFLRTKKQTIGGFIQALNSLEYIANNFTKYYFEGASLFDILEVSQNITKEDIYNTMDEFLDLKRYSSCTVIPKK